MERLIRNLLLKLLTGEREIRFTRRIPSREELRAELESVDALGLYLHIPFCEQICPYCPYNKERYCSDLAEAYVRAVTAPVPDSVHPSPHIATRGRETSTSYPVYLLCAIVLTVAKG